MNWTNDLKLVIALIMGFSIRYRYEVCDYSTTRMWIIGAIVVLIAVILSVIQAMIERCVSLSTVNIGTIVKRNMLKVLYFVHLFVWIQILHVFNVPVLHALTIGMIVTALIKYTVFGSPKLKETL